MPLVGCAALHGTASGDPSELRAYYGSVSTVCAQRQIICTKRLKNVPQRDAVAADERAADRRADAQIDRSSSASDA
eukprot:5036208-Pleurochrysis_carterae.AAC.1